MARRGAIAVYARWAVRWKPCSINWTGAVVASSRPAATVEQRQTVRDMTLDAKVLTRRRISGTCSRDEIRRVEESSARARMVYRGRATRPGRLWHPRVVVGLVRDPDATPRQGPQSSRCWKGPPTGGSFRAALWQAHPLRRSGWLVGASSDVLCTYIWDDPGSIAGRQSAAYLVIGTGTYYLQN